VPRDYVGYFNESLIGLTGSEVKVAQVARHLDILRGMLVEVKSMK
jgi:hypothetical protein